MIRQNHSDGVACFRSESVTWIADDYDPAGACIDRGTDGDPRLSDDQSTVQEWWDVRYRNGQTPWDREAVSPALYHWLDTASLSQGRILVPGCGRGYEVVELARLGFEVTALDIAPTPIAVLRQRLEEEKLHAEVVQVDLFAWQPVRPYDAVYEQTTLCALPPARWRAYASRLQRWLRPGGRLFALFMQTGCLGGPPFHCALSDMKQLFAPDYWLWPDTSALEIPHPAGFVEKGYVLCRQRGLTVANQKEKRRPAKRDRY